ncbi:MAG: hypothetical protein H6750_12775 [Nitrospiraceae bacterium]|nr:hypothetical protein [Nitrospira sp.]MCB9775178.1 hypothetical protein [Nitrospiraceae bacterium]
MTRRHIPAPHIILQKACGKYIQKRFGHGRITIPVNRDMYVRGIIGSCFGDWIFQQAVHLQSGCNLLLKLPMLLLYK